MNKIVAAVAIDGNFLEKSDYFNDYPFPRLLDFKENELVISNYFKMKTNDYRDHLITIPYDDIQDISLRIVKRVKGQRISLLNAYYNFDFHISTNENGEWDNNYNKNYVFPIEKKSVELIVLDDEPVSLGHARKLRKSYIWSKKIRLAIYKIITYLPKVISGNYKKKASEQ